MVLDMFKLDGKVAIVTGANTGLGQGMCIGLAEAGAKVVGVARRSCDETAEKIKEIGGEFTTVIADLSTTDVIDTVISEALKAYGRIDILVNNAGVGGKPLKMVDMDEAYFDMYVDADIKALYFLSKLAALQMKAQGCEAGTHPYRIINMASVAGMKSPIGDTVYGSCKAAVIHLTRIMANELARFGITSNSVSPGYVLTDMTKDVIADEKNAAAVNRMITLRRYAQPAEIASVVRFVASPAGGYLTGVNIAADGGMVLN